MSPEGLRPAPEHRHPRRRDRSREVEWIEAFLRTGGVAVLAAVRDGRPICLPRVYAYDPERKALYLHGAHGGELGEVLEPLAGAPLALTVFEMGRLLPADEAAEFSVEFASVVVSGRAMVVEDPAEAMHGLQLLMDKYAPHLRAGEDYRPLAPEEVARTTVLRVDIDAWSGKEKTEAEDFPGAYRFGEVAGRRNEAT